MDKPDLAALLGSRICHDLISPLGAIGNGVELLMMDGQTTGPEVALIAESVANSNARIRFFRVAFGAASTDQRIGRPEILSILADSTKGGRLKVEWRLPGDQLRREVKLAFLAIQCLENAMPWGGRIIADRENGRWTVAGAGRRLRFEPGLWESLSVPEGPADLTPAQVQFGLLFAEAAATGRCLSVETGETAASITF